MRIKNYRQFNEELFFRKKSKRMGTKEFIEWAIENYKSLGNDPHVLNHVDIIDDDCITYWDKSQNYQVSLDEKDGKYFLTDFNDENGKMGPKEKDVPGRLGRYKVYPVEITKEEFDKYKKAFKEIDDYLDIKDDEERKKKLAVVSPQGDILNISDDPMEEASYLITQELGKYIGKSFTFDTDYVIWDSGSSNNSSTKEIEETSMKIKEFKIDNYKSWDDEDEGKKPVFFGKIVADWSVDGKEYEIMIDNTYKPEWIDLEKAKFTRDMFSKFLKPHTTEEKTRRSRKVKNTYPMSQLFAMSPSKYNTIEMINDFLSIIEGVNGAGPDDFKASV